MSVIDLFYLPGDNPEAMATDGEFIYWGSNNFNSVGRARPDGSDVEPTWIKAEPGSEVASVYGVAVDKTHVYWSGTKTDIPPEGESSSSIWRIGRAKRDGTSVQQSWVAIAAGSKREPQGLLVTDTHLYWAQEGGHIGRVALDGSGADRDWFDTGGSPYTMATDGEWLYWGDVNQPVYIGRVRFDGSGSEPNLVQLDLNASVEGIAVVDDHVCWGDQGNHCLGRAKLDGSDPEPVWLWPRDGHSSRPQGMTFDGTHVYFSMPEEPAGIGRCQPSDSTVSAQGAAVVHPFASGNHLVWGTTPGSYLGAVLDHTEEADRVTIYDSVTGPKGDVVDVIDAPANGAASHSFPRPGRRVLHGLWVDGPLTGSVFQ